MQFCCQIIVVLIVFAVFLSCVWSDMKLADRDGQLQGMIAFGITLVQGAVLILVLFGAGAFSRLVE